jgi:hypothetical protein
MTVGNCSERVAAMESIPHGEGLRGIHTNATAIHPGVNDSHRRRRAPWSLHSPENRAKRTEVAGTTAPHVTTRKSVPPQVRQSR